MDQLQQYSSLADVQQKKKKKKRTEKKKKHLMLRSFWQAATVLFIYTSIMVYSTHKSNHRLLDSVMEWIK